MFCKGNSTAGLGVAGMKCEGKSTFFKGIAVCEGALQNFVKKGFTTPEGKLIKSTKAYGCLGTSVGASFNSSSNTYTDGFTPTAALDVEAALAGDSALASTATGRQLSRVHKICFQYSQGSLVCNT